MAQKWRELGPLFSRHCHCAIIFYFSATATCPPFSVRASSAVALNVAQGPCNDYLHDKVNFGRPHFFILDHARLKVDGKLNPNLE